DVNELHITAVSQDPARAVRAEDVLATRPGRRVGRICGLAVANPPGSYPSPLIPGEHALAIGTEARAGHRVAVPRQRPHLLACVRVPQPHRTVNGRARQSLAVGAVADTIDNVGVPL